MAERETEPPALHPPRRARWTACVHTCACACVLGRAGGDLGQRCGLLPLSPAPCVTPQLRYLRWLPAAQIKGRLPRLAPGSRIRAPSPTPVVSVAPALCPCQAELFIAPPADAALRAFPRQSAAAVKTGLHPGRGDPLSAGPRRAVPRFSACEVGTTRAPRSPACRGACMSQ